MPQVTIVILENEDGEVDVKSHFEPAVNLEDEDKNPTSHFVAMRMLNSVADAAESAEPI
jgi:hypothetical protein